MEPLWDVSNTKEQTKDLTRFMATGTRDEKTSTYRGSAQWNYPEKSAASFPILRIRSVNAII